MCLFQVHSARHKLIKQDSLTTFESFTKFQEKCKTELPNEEAIEALIEAIEAEGSDIVDISLPACVVGTAINQWLEVFRRNTELQRIK
jgi:fatty acid-binding protein DegV